MKPPSPAVEAQALALSGAACALFDANDAPVWTNAATSALAPELRRAVFGATALRRDVLDTGRPARRRVEAGPPDDLRSFTTRLTRVEGEDGAWLVLCAAIDVTAEMRALAALRRVETRAEDLLGLVSDIVWETDAEWRFTYLSLRGEAASSAREFLGWRLFDFGRFEGGRRRPTPATRAIFRDQPFVATLGATELTFMLSAVPLFDEVTGDFVGYRGAGEDATARLSAERDAEAARARLMETLAALEARNRDLAHALAAAQAADHAKAAFLARMSHELRTPLNAVLGLAQLVTLGAADAIDDKHRGYLGEIERSGRHLLALVEDLLEFARNEAAPPRLESGPLDLGAIAAESAAFLRLTAEERGQRLIVECAEGLTIEGDATRLRQVFINLIGNAVKFTQRGGTVRVTAERADGKVRVRVADDGPGVSPEKLARVFEPFFQAEDGANAGVGLGLALARQFVEMHGGVIDMESAPGAGATVTVTLALARQENSDKAA